MTNGDVWLRDLRKTLGLTQSEMAGQMGLSLRPYQRLESKDDGGSADVTSASPS